MLTFLLYEGKAAVALAVFYMFYRLLLKKESFHRLNRMVLVGMVVASFLLPLCIITIHRPMETASTEMTEAIVPMAGAAGTASGSWLPAALTVLFFAGLVFVLARVLASVLSIARIIRQGRCVREEDGCKIIVTERGIDPFSWMRYIVLSRADWESPNASILTHEKAHIRHGHSVELLLVDILTAFQWFNPAIWMLRMDLQELHEYEADDAVLRSGANIKEYQYLLIKKAVAKSGYSVANSFNHSILKNRIRMMTRAKSPLVRGLRALYLLPVVCLGIGLQARTVYDRPDRGFVYAGSAQGENSVLNIMLTADGKVICGSETMELEDFAQFFKEKGDKERGENEAVQIRCIQVSMEKGAPEHYMNELKDVLRKEMVLKMDFSANK